MKQFEIFVLGTTCVEVQSVYKLYSIVLAHYNVVLAHVKHLVTRSIASYLNMNIYNLKGNR